MHITGSQCDQRSTVSNQTVRTGHMATNVFLMASNLFCVAKKCIPYSYKFLLTATNIFFIAENLFFVATDLFIMAAACRFIFVKGFHALCLVGFSAREYYDYIN